jgi:cephalosporin-C deacetylase-like acetyl esterase
LGQQAAPPDEVPLSFTPFHATGIYSVGETVGWSITPKGKGNTVPYHYEARRNNQAVVKSGTLDLMSGSTTIEVPGTEPEMLLVTITANTPPPTKGTQQKTLLGAAVSPTLLKPSLPRPADFLAFWKGKLEEQAKVPLNPAVVAVKSPKPGADLYIVKLDALNSHVHGYLAKPIRPGKYPALLVYQWAGVYKLNPNVATGYASDGWLTFDVDSHDLDPTDDTALYPDYTKVGDRNREQSYFLDMLLRDTRALDYISRLKEWDGKTIVVIGNSMGGWQSLATAGLNPGRVNAVIVLEPAGLDSNADLHGRKAGFPYWPSDDPAVMSTAQYFDPVNFAPEITAPTIMAAGFLDTTAPPAGIYTAFNLIKAPKQFVPLLNSGHHDAHPTETQADYTHRLKEALESIRLTGKLTLP